jgi:16S rRNA (adenine1518-N6/adenine1519-N6)-dimethyltransferase
MSTSEGINLTSLSQVRSLLAEHGIRPSKALGQNFLIDLNILNILLDTAALSSRDRVLEIGPGLGVVTEQLLERVQRVVAVEKDERLFALLKQRFGGRNNLDLVCGDMLEVGPGILAESRLDNVVSNLPYSAGSRILADIAMSGARPRRITVTVQEEVADRLAAQPGSKNYGLLSVWLQADYDIGIAKKISPTCFWPRPEVQSVIISMTRHDRHKMTPLMRKSFYKLTKQMFTYRRKQLSTILARMGGTDRNAAELSPRRSRPTALQSEDMNDIHGGRLASAATGLLAELGIDPRARPENLSIDDWLNLAARMAHGTHQS